MAAIVEAALHPSGLLHRRNNLDIMRLLAAVLVIFSHSYATVGAREPRSVLDPTGLAWGHFGILVFFSISGYLIASSWNSNPSVIAYWKKRIARIFPALAVATAGTAWVIGSFVTSVPLVTYFSNPNTWLYPLTKALIFIPGNVDPPGLFLGNPSPEVNASLWTLALEVACYFGLMALMLLKLGRPKVLVPLVVIAAVVGNQNVLDLLPNGDAPVLELGGRLLILVATFFMGSALFMLRERVRLRPIVALFVLAAAAGLGFTAAGPSAAAILLPYVFMTFGMAFPVLPVGWLGGTDLSYGTYVFAFPIQQSIVHFTGTRDPLYVSVITLVIVLPLAAMSWRLVEKPALARARGRAPRSAYIARS